MASFMVLTNRKAITSSPLGLTVNALFGLLPAAGPMLALIALGFGPDVCRDRPPHGNLQAAYLDIQEIHVLLG